MRIQLNIMSKDFKIALTKIKCKEIEIHLSQAQRSLDSGLKVYLNSGEYDLYYAGYVESTVDSLKHTLEFLRDTLKSGVRDG